MQTKTKWNELRLRDSDGHLHIPERSAAARRYLAEYVLTGTMPMFIENEDGQWDDRSGPQPWQIDWTGFSGDPRDAMGCTLP